MDNGCTAKVNKFASANVTSLVSCHRPMWDRECSTATRSEAWHDQELIGVVVIPRTKAHQDE